MYLVLVDDQQFWSNIGQGERVRTALEGMKFEKILKVGDVRNPEIGEGLTVIPTDPIQIKNC